jgi:hypothetical protein
MTLTINLPPEVEQAARRYAARSGEELSAFVLQAVKEKIARSRTFAEVSAPFAQAVKATGMTDEEFDRFFEDVRQEVWDEKQGKPS